MEEMEHSALVPSRRRVRGPSGSGEENGNRTKKRNKNYEDAKKLPETLNTQLSPSSERVKELWVVHHDGLYGERWSLS